VWRRRKGDPVGQSLSMKGRIQMAEVARPFKYREARMGIRAGRGAYWEEDEGKDGVRGPRVTRATVGYLVRDSSWKAHQKGNRETERDLQLDPNHESMALG
jgi:hypothetical protein